MMVKRLSITLLLTLAIPSWAGQKQCPTSASDCKQCIQSDPECAWCVAPGAKLRCDTVKRHHRAGCTGIDLYNPQGTLYILRNEPRRSGSRADERDIDLEPQEISLSLRPGVIKSFHLATTKNQPTPEMDTSGVPEGLNISFTKQSEDVLVEVHVAAAHCRDQNRTGPWSVQITPRGLSQSLKLTVSVECECECMKNGEENSPSCDGRGTLQCGVCQCDEPYHGKQCEVDPDSQNDDACRLNPSSLVCSGDGKCVDGFCECRIRENPSERYSGKFCECDDFNCDRQNNRICAGHGRCECRRCVCDKGWVGSDCGCFSEATPCMASNQMICNGRGICECGVCKCMSPYGGPTCEDCPFCGNTCEEHAACVECRAFQTGAKKNTCKADCSGLALRTVNSRDDIHQGSASICRMVSRDDSCTFHYSIARTPGGPLATVWTVKECPPPL